jgi:hypothetical protein
MTEIKVQGQGPNCSGCFARQVTARNDAIANGEEPKPLCVVAQRMQAMLDASLDELREPAQEQDNTAVLIHTGKMT